jgi:predicted transcriptional regulator
MAKKVLISRSIIASTLNSMVTTGTITAEEKKILSDRPVQGGYRKWYDVSYDTGEMIERILPKLIEVVSLTMLGRMDQDWEKIASSVRADCENNYQQLRARIL